MLEPFEVRRRDLVEDRCPHQDRDGIAARAAAVKAKAAALPQCLEQVTGKLRQERWSPRWCCRTQHTCFGRTLIDKAGAPPPEMSELLAAASFRPCRTCRRRLMTWQRPSIASARSAGGCRTRWPRPGARSRRGADARGS